MPRRGSDVADRASFVPTGIRFGGWFVGYCLRPRQDTSIAKVSSVSDGGVHIRRTSGLIATRLMMYYIVIQ